MPSSATCDWLDLAAGIEQLVGDIAPDTAAEMERVVPRVARKGAKAVREEAASRWGGEVGQRYSSGFSSRTTKSGVETTAEIGNRNVPGLVHLLEKGHQTVPEGRRVPGNPHVAPVFERVVVPELEREVAAGVDRALEG